MSIEKFIIAIIIVSLIFLFALVFQKRHYRNQLKQLNCDLDKLLLRGTPLPIDKYSEGELSILANQMEKVTLRLQESNEKVKKDKIYLADSLADISHQLRTPLTSMNLAVTMLRSSDLDYKKRIELTSELRKQLNRIDWLVESLLKISKLDAGTISLSHEPVEIKKLILKSAEPLAVALDVNEQKLSIDCRDEHFYGDLNWTSEAIGNILKNCMEHSPHGGTIYVSSKETPIYTEITIEDTGKGFAPEDIPHLFERFYQGKNPSPESYGIGLALARSIITSQNGIIQAGNGNHGAKFIIKFYKQVI